MIPLMALPRIPRCASKPDIEQPYKGDNTRTVTGDKPTNGKKRTKKDGAVSDEEDGVGNEARKRTKGRNVQQDGGDLEREKVSIHEQ